MAPAPAQIHQSCADERCSHPANTGSAPLPNGDAVPTASTHHADYGPSPAVQCCLHMQVLAQLEARGCVGNEVRCMWHPNVYKQCNYLYAYCMRWGQLVSTWHGCATQKLNSHLGLPQGTHDKLIRCPDFCPDGDPLQAWKRLS